MTSQVSSLWENQECGNTGSGMHFIHESVRSTEGSWWIEAASLSTVSTVPPPHRAVIPQWGQVRPSNHRAGGRENARSMTAAWWPKWSKGDIFKEAFWFWTQFLWKRRGKIGNYKTEASRYCFNRGVAPCRMKSWPRAPQAASTAGSKRETVNRVCVVPATTTHVVICWAFWNHTYWEPTLCSQGRAEWPRLCLQGPGWNRATNPSSRTSQLHERK